MENEHQFLSQIAKLVKDHEDNAKASGENFNIFNVLGLNSKELIHSKFIAMLLNPKGEHEMGMDFFKLFAETISLDKCGEYDFSHVRVETERTFRDGQIDILVTSRDNRHIIIENKIYAGDKNEQLMRYHGFSPNVVILYLTLDGHEPEEQSVKTLVYKKDYFCISYKEHILEWLNKCFQNAQKNPFLCKAVEQYIFLIKQLTKQGRSKSMNDELLNAIAENEKNITAYLGVRKIEPLNVFKHIIMKKTFPKLEEIAKKNDLKVKITFLNDNHNILDVEYGFKFYKESGWGAVYIWFAFAQNLRDLICGIFNTEETNKMKKGWQKEFSLENSDWHWDRTDVLAKLCLSDNDVIKEIEENLKELIPIVDEMVNS